VSRFVHSIQALALAWGAPGIVLVAFLDSSVLSLPEIADLLVIWMVAMHPARFAVYVSSATLGSLLGCLTLYYIGKGTETLVKSRISTHRYEKTLSAFRRHGVMAVLVPSLLPPPAPFKPFVLLAGIAEISVAKFTTAILIGRGARYFIEGLLALWYGERAIAYIREHGVEVAVTAVVVVLAGFIVYLRWPRARHSA
jgi:membrane protein YqaA with SNARE-associated domain